MTSKGYEETSMELFAQFLKEFNAHAEKGTMEFMLSVNPVPASRPRVSKYGSYYGKRYERFRKEAAEATLDYKGLKVEGPVAVFCENVVVKPKSTKRLYPNGDTDNFVKGPLDAMTKSERFWIDDTQVVLLTSTKRFTCEGEEPHVMLYWFEI